MGDEMTALSNLTGRAQTTFSAKALVLGFEATTKEMLPLKNATTVTTTMEMVDLPCAQSKTNTNALEEMSPTKMSDFCSQFLLCKTSVSRMKY
jgi:hypothetical protein